MLMPRYENSSAVTNKQQGIFGVLEPVNRMVGKDNELFTLLWLQDTLTCSQQEFAFFIVLEQIRAEFRR